MATNKVQAIAGYLENLPLFKVAVMGEGLSNIHAENVRASSPWDALRMVVDRLGPDIKLSQFGVLALHEEPKKRGKV